MPRSDTTAISDILSSAKLILEFSEKISFTEFEKDVEPLIAILEEL